MAVAKRGSAKIITPAALWMRWAQVREPVDITLVLAMDVSRSMSMRELEIQRAGYAAAIRHSGIVFDVMFGPAYKGIPLAAVTAAIANQGETVKGAFRSMVSAIDNGGVTREEEAAFLDNPLRNGLLLARLAQLRVASTLWHVRDLASHHAALAAQVARAGAGAARHAA
jgi:hypothetical protein